MKKETVGFQFQTISLDDARSMALVGGGAYADLKEEALARIKTQQPNESFAFGLPKGAKIDPKENKNIKISLNMTLQKAGLPWRVIYLESKKLFACIPAAAPGMRKLPTKKHQESQPVEGGSDRLAHLLKVAADVFKPADFSSATPGSRAARAAICVVGVKDLGISKHEISKAIGLSSGGVMYNVKINRGSIQLDMLRKATKGTH